MKRIYEKLHAQCPHLEKLVLGQSFFFDPQLLINFDQKLSGLTRLSSLKLLYIATDSMMINISEHCPRLRELSVRGSDKISDECVDHMIRCRNLNVLDIQGTKISGKGCLKIIQCCHSLEWIEHCPFNCDSDFKIFRSRKEMIDLIRNGFESSPTLSNAEHQNNEDVDEENNRIFSIKNFWLFNPKTEELNVSPLFPKLEKFRIDFVFQDMRFTLDLNPLKQFHHLNTLDINFYDNHNNQLLDRILSSCGAKIKTLVFNVCADYRYLTS